MCTLWKLYEGEGKYVMLMTEYLMWSDTVLFILMDKWTACAHLFAYFIQCSSKDTIGSCFSTERLTNNHEAMSHSHHLIDLCRNMQTLCSPSNSVLLLKFSVQLQ